MRLPAWIEGDGFVLRRWTMADAEAMQQAVDEAVEHLRPWVRWVDEEPSTVEGRRELIAEWDRLREAGGGTYFGIHVGGRIAGGCGAQPRGGGVVEIGFWLRPAFLGQGLATRAAGLLTETALAHPKVAAVEIRHDRANAASRAVAVRLGFKYAGEAPNPAPAPADEGVDLVWRRERAPRVSPAAPAAARA
ncbi:MAG TPA: GNAT family N-acetyltransferase [Solirubrobacteraceae bacterium]|jgi:RimJ/RimL family protein N-acetyltransferase